MPQFIPFKGVLYNQSKVSLGDVFAPPYDIISSEKQNELYARSEYNFVKLDFPKEENKYALAKERYDKWRNENILMQDEEQSFYLLEQHFTSNFKALLKRIFLP